jgi:hypothetical protein
VEDVIFVSRALVTLVGLLLCTLPFDSSAQQASLCDPLSPCTLPEASDHRFVVEDPEPENPHPDTGLVCPQVSCALEPVFDPFLGEDRQVCFPHRLFVQDPGLIEIPIPVGRVVGPVDASGQLTHQTEQVDAGTLGATAKLTIVTRDRVHMGEGSSLMTGFDYTVTENHRAFLNGTEIAGLRGVNSARNRARVRTEIELDVGALRFPERRPDLSDPDASPEDVKPIPADNVLRIEVGSLQQASPLDGILPGVGLRYCTEVEWVSLEIGAMSPVVLVHGNNSDPGFWNRHGFAQELDTRTLPIDGCESCSVPLELDTAPVSDNGRTLAGIPPGLLTSHGTLGPVERIVRSFGANSYHIVAHSKGGLDSREFLARYGDGLELISHTTLGTPHNGTQLADVQDAKRIAASIAADTEFPDIPGFEGLLVSLVPPDQGTKDLTTYAAIDFNRRNIPNLPDADYNQIAGDADRNGSLSIDLLEEWVALNLDSTALGSAALVGAAEPLIDLFYQTLRETRNVGLLLSYRNVPGPGGLTSSLQPVVNVIRELGGENLNDTLVPVESALAFGPMPQTRSAVFEGPDGRNHSSISEADVAALVSGWLIEAEQRRGDLR